MVRHAPPHHGLAHRLASSTGSVREPGSAVPLCSFPMMRRCARRDFDLDARMRRLKLLDERRVDVGANVMPPTSRMVPLRCRPSRKRALVSSMSSKMAAEREQRGPCLRNANRSSDAEKQRFVELLLESWIWRLTADCDTSTDVRLVNDPASQSLQRLQLPNQGRALLAVNSIARREEPGRRPRDY